MINSRPVRRGVRTLLVAMSAVGLVLVLVPAAAAAETRAAADTVVWYQPRYNSIPAEAAYTGECFGREGRFKGGAFILKVDWNRDKRWDECFGISPDRQIFHAWPSSVGWDPMPHGGRADNTHSAFLYQGRHHTITVQVKGVGYYCSSNIGGSWRPWGRCTPRGPQLVSP